MTPDRFLQHRFQEVFTNSSTTTHEVALLQPYTVYSFKISAVNSVGRSKPSRNSYPAITLRESKAFC
jgi:receptor-type tyrosine-protein phosphatase gamma